MTTHEEPQAAKDSSAIRARLKTVANYLFPQSRFSVWLFIRLLGIINVIAFASLEVQIDGLIGSEGIIPAERFLEQVELYQGGKHTQVLPTLCWLNCSDAFLHGLCLVGIISGICLAIGFTPWLFLSLCWICYLSLSQVGQSFFTFQWDVLLLEVNLCGLFLIPLSSMRIRGPRHTRYHRLGMALIFLLLFKLMFSSGMVKITSEDPYWANKTAMEYHYQSQPLPRATAWYAHKLPPGIHAAETWTLFIIELLFPFCIFLPRIGRLIGFSGLALLQLLIMATGNYCFFNLLTLALCLPLIDDQSWQKIPWLNKRLADPQTFNIPPLQIQIRRWIALPIGTILALMMLIQTASTTFQKNLWFPPLGALKDTIAPYRSANSYGLFAIMTTQRPEIILQGSHDGVHWRDYAFKYKPGKLEQRPRLVAPHQPRLDWQFWFAALAWEHPQPARTQPWLYPLVERLLEGEEVVLELLGKNPFPNKPPKYIRAVTYDYTFTTAAEREETGDWWKREELRPYFQPASLRVEVGDP
jgi:hypothetical protein